MALIIDQISGSLLFLKTTAGEESGRSSVNEPTKKFQNLVNPRICSLHFEETEVKVSISGRKSVTACPTIFDPASLKKTTSETTENRQMKRCEHEPAAKKRCPRKLDFKNAT